MSELIKHECAIALVRLRKPLSYYQEKYGTAHYGLNKLQILIQKMRNRGQDGAGLATVRLNPEPGTRYISRYRTAAKDYINDLFDNVYASFNGLSTEQLSDVDWLQKNKPYMGEVLLGHLRYGTYGLKTIETCHPFLRQNNWISRNFVLAGNFNLTNVDQLFDELVELGQHPKEKSDTVTVLEKIGHFLDYEVQRLFDWFKRDGFTNEQITELITDNLDFVRVLKRACKHFDGGYVMGGIVGHGDAFMIRDPNAIRPGYYYVDDEVVVAASERPAIQTAFGVQFEQVQELKPSNALIIKKNGQVEILPFIKDAERKACSFERIYFSRGTDKNIYEERKKLGYNLTDDVLEAIDYDIANTVLTYVPNTAETAFFGLVSGMEEYLNGVKTKQVSALGGSASAEDIKHILDQKLRVEKLIVKDAKMRTFIADTDNRNQLVSYVYDVTYGIVNREVDTLVVLDDSIVRGTTLRDSILTMLGRLKPKKIVVVSSAPQIRYPDFYGIDMSQIGHFVAFQAMVTLLKERGLEQELDRTYKLCKESIESEDKNPTNYVKALYDHFTMEEISEGIAKLLNPEDFGIPIKIVYQDIQGLHDSSPRHTGDWYFSGDYPTSGGRRLVNKAFVYYMEGNNNRPY